MADFDRSVTRPGPVMLDRMMLSLDFTGRDDGGVRPDEPGDGADGDRVRPGHRRIVHLDSFGDHARRARCPRIWLGGIGWRAPPESMASMIASLVNAGGTNSTVTSDELANTAACENLSALLV